MTNPLFPEEPTLLDPASGTRAWFFDSACTIVDQTGGDMTLDVARFLTGRVEEELQRRYVREGKKVCLVHDWRSVVSYEAEARSMLIDWGRVSRPHVEQVSLQLSDKASPFVRIAAATGVSLLRVARMKIELIDDLEPIVRRLSAAPKS